MHLLTPVRCLRELTSTDGRRRLRRRWRYLWRAAGRRKGAATLECRLGGGLRIRVSTLDQSISKALYVDGAFEEAELRLIRAWVGPNATVVDVGANIGLHTLVLADCVGAGGVVHAFEPSAAYDALQGNVALNAFDARVVLNRRAVGAKAGVLTLMECKPGYEAFTSQGSPLKPEYATGRLLEVPMTSLDLYARDASIEVIDFLKVDAEGSEVQVLQGAQGLLEARRIHAVMLEVNEYCLAQCGSSADELIVRLRRGGFELWVLERAGGELVPCTDTPRGNWVTVVGRLPGC